MKHEHMAAWKPEEDQVILALYAKEGRKWGRIAAALPGRTSASVRNRYLRIEKGQKLRDAGLSKNRCAACGQQKIGHVCPVKLNLVYNEQMLAYRQQAHSSMLHEQMMQPHMAMGHTPPEFAPMQYVAPGLPPFAPALPPMAEGYEYAPYASAPAECPPAYHFYGGQDPTMVRAVQPFAALHDVPFKPVGLKNPNAFLFPLKKRTSVPGLCRVASAG